MANVTINSLSETASGSLTSSHFFVIDNGSGTTKLAALSAAIKTITTLGSAGAGVVKSFALGVLSQRDIVGGTGITVAQNTNDLTLSVTQGDININNLTGIGSFDLSAASNSSSAFLSTVNLAANVGSTILPVANGGTGRSSLTANSLIVGGTSLSSVVLDADLELAVGTSSGPAMKTLTAGANVAITQDNSANTVTVAFSKGNFIETNDTPTFGNTVLAEATVDKILTSGTKAATQTSSITSSVTCNGSAGVITLVSSTVAATTVHNFTLENTEITANSVIMLTLQNPTNADEDNVHVSLQSVQAGRAVINIANNTATQATAQIRKIHFIVMN
jgi:hypothetical protein